MARGIFLASSMAALLPVMATAQLPPACQDVLVTSHTVNLLRGADVATDAAGSFVVVWHEDAYPQAPIGVFGRRFDAAGSALGPTFQVNSTLVPYLNQRDGVAAAADGSFVVTWTGADIDIFGPRDVRARRYSATGVPLGGEFTVNTFTTGNQQESNIVGLPDGRFIVAWAGAGPGTSSGVFAQAFDAAGVRAGPERRVDSYTTGAHHFPSVAMNNDGSFVVVWSNFGQDGDSEGIFGQRFDAAGSPAGPEFAVNNTTVGRQELPAVATDASGNFVVVWQERNGSAVRALARRFDSSGAPQGSEFIPGVVPSVTASSPSVAFDAAGSFRVTWSDVADGDGLAVLGRRFSGSGVPLGAPFVVNTSTAGFQGSSAVAPAPHGGAVTAWISAVSASLREIRAGVECSRLYTVPPCRLVDTRNPPGPSGGPAFGPNTQRSFPITGVCGIPADARAVVLTVTAAGPTDLGFFRLFPAGQAVPFTSAVNFTAGRARAGNAMVALGSDGQLTARCDMFPGSTGSAHLVLDVTGYFKR
jgi:hypothetical protein